MTRPSPTGARVHVLDGGTGSELRRRGVAFREACWSAEANLTHGEMLTAIHRDYLRAGADVITANTFATSRFVLAGAGLDAQFREINVAAIQAARRALIAPFEHARLAASLSCLAPRFDASAYPDADTEYRAYAELTELFADEAVDLLLLEMMQDTVHAPRACRAARAAGLEFWIGLSCRRETTSGTLVAFDDAATPIAAVIETLLPFEPAGFAVMHSPVDAVSPALALLRERWAGPLGAYAEIRYPEDPEHAGSECAGKDRSGPEATRPSPEQSQAMTTAAFATTPESYAVAARDWLAHGVSLIGGCCGTTPAHVATLRRLLD